jgi:hypothetical protein
MQTSFLVCICLLIFSKATKKKVKEKSDVLKILSEKIGFFASQRE